ncbi:hypothetical protein [Streptomyces sp. OE57]|uniref:hypothetical protein n=1 Tax=Streptomyces lacaronensis TaxID=3379885 RepID=UPI0039B77763
MAPDRVADAVREGRDRGDGAATHEQRKVTLTADRPVAPVVIVVIVVMRDRNAAGEGCDLLGG